MVPGTDGVSSGPQEPQFEVCQTIVPLVCLYQASGPVLIRLEADNEQLLEHQEPSIQQQLETSGSFKLTLEFCFYCRCKCLILVETWSTIPRFVSVPIC